MNLDFTYQNPTTIYFGKNALDNLRDELGATEEMLPLIANSTFLLGGYKVLTKEEVLEILKSAYAAV